MMKKRYVYFLFSALFFATAIILNKTYRLYVYENHIFDFHLADTISSIIAIPSAFCLYLSANKGLIKTNKVIFQIVTTFILIEILDYWKLLGTFDLYDIIAYIMSGFITYFIFRVFFGKEYITA